MVAEGGNPSAEKKRAAVAVGLSLYTSRRSAGHCLSSPVGFKFSYGYQAPVLVEMKRLMGTVRHSYEKQLEIYLDASRSQHGIFVVMDYSDLSDKLDQIEQMLHARLAAGERASDIIVFNASKKESASERK